MSDFTPPEEPSPPSQARSWAVLALLVGAIVIVGAITISSDDEDDGTDAALSSGAPSTTTATPPGGCTPAPSDAVDVVASGLIGDAAQLDDTFVTAESDRAYFTANIFDVSGQRVSSADTWIIDSGTVYALSGSANEYSSFPDGRDLPDRPSAGNPVPRALQGCAVEAIIGN